MELTDEQLEFIRQASKEIDYGKITVNFTGSPSYTVDIIPEKRVRFQCPPECRGVPKKDGGRQSGFRRG